jgi:hypothetical protein
MADEPNQWFDGAALKHNLDASTPRASTAPTRAPAKPAMSATRLTRSRAAVARRSPQDERPTPTMANDLAREPKCSDACTLTNAALTRGRARCGLRASRLTFDMSGDRQAAKLAVGRPLDGRVRPPVEHGRIL